MTRSSAATGSNVSAHMDVYGHPSRLPWPQSPNRDIIVSITGWRERGERSSGLRAAARLGRCPANKVREEQLCQNLGLRCITICLSRLVFFVSGEIGIVGMATHLSAGGAAAGFSIRRDIRPRLYGAEGMS